VLLDTIDRLRRFRSADAPVLSVYVAVPADPGELRSVEPRLHTLLKPARSLANSDELAHDEQQSLRADIAQVMELVPRASALQGRAVAVFACHREKLHEEVVLPRLVRDRVEVDATPYLRPLLAVLDESHRYCVVIVERARAWMYVYEMRELMESTKVRGWGPRKRDFAGGWHGYKERNVHNRAAQLSRRHFHETANAVDDLVQRTGAELVIVGGHEETVAEFLPFLPHHLQSRVAGTFVIDPHTMSPGRVREHAEEVVDAYERNEETRLVAEALDRVGAHGLGAAGLEWCLDAATAEAIQLLLVHGDEVVPGRVCDNCGWLGLDGGECPVCGHPVRETPDVIDEMVAAVIDVGGRAEHVYADTALAQHRVAAFLRFPVPAPRATEATAANS
jgi:peptide chain release factor subunit 1